MSPNAGPPSQNAAPAFGASPDAGRRAWLPALAIPPVAAGFLAFSGAFGLDALPLGPRFVYWLGLLVLGQIGFMLLGRALGPAALYGPRRLAAAAVIALAGSVPMSLVVWAVTAWSLGKSLASGSLLGFYLAVVAVTAAMTGLHLLAERQAPPVPEPVPEPAPEPVPETVAETAPLASAAPALAPLRARLPDRLKAAPILALQAEDHYVRVHTAAGNDLILIRFADALKELGGIEGAQVHRSWWVARAAVEGSKLAGDKRLLAVRGGLEVPVSRNYAKALREAGWFD